MNVINLINRLIIIRFITFNDYMIFQIIKMEAHPVICAASLKSVSSCPQRFHIL